MNLLLATLILAQQIKLGAVADLPLLRPLAPDTYFAAPHENSRNLAGGAAFEISLGRMFGVEISALRKTAHSRRTDGIASRQVSGSITVDTDIASWEFPVLGKVYSRGVARVRPYFGLGFSTRKTDGHAYVQGVSTNNFVPQPPFTWRDDAIRRNWITGLVLAGGVEIPFRRLSISPEFRHTRWGQSAIRAPAPAVTREIFPGEGITAERDLDLLIRFSFSP